MKRDLGKRVKQGVSQIYPFLLLKLWGVLAISLASLLMRGTLVWILAMSPILCGYKPCSATADSGFLVWSRDVFRFCRWRCECSAPPSPTKSICGSLPLSGSFAMDMATSSLADKLEQIEDTTW